MCVRRIPADTSLESVFDELGLDHEVRAALSALWGKSRKHGGGKINLLLSHLLDSAAVAEQLWERYLSRRTRQLLNSISGGHGRVFFMWLCAVHDCGKATPAFQRVDPEGASRARAAGLTWNEATLKRSRWRHDKAGAALLRGVLGRHWEREHIAWVWPLVAGHHGAFPTKHEALGAKAHSEHQGAKLPLWARTQHALIAVISHVLGYSDLVSVQPTRVPGRAEQLLLSGLIIMADWIASNHRHFEGIEEISRVGLASARDRAAAAMKALKLRGGWEALRVPQAEDLVAERFEHKSRPFQKALVEAVQEMSGPGIVVVEAPMGEGKTDGALAGAEVMAARFGCDGVFVGMPTQATSDPIYDKVRSWVSGFDPDLKAQVALLHGKKMFNPAWRDLWRPQDGAADDDYSGVACDEFGMDDGFGVVTRAPEAERFGPALWFLGRNRGLLTPFAVGTIDQLLFAATRTRHVMLRFAGLASKVVVLDEVHTADVYMSRFLTEALRWLGQARVPVILLSATLAPAQREELVKAYLQGALNSTDTTHIPAVPTPNGYPSVTTAHVDEGRVVMPDPRVTDSRNRSSPVRLEWLPDVSDEGKPVVERVVEETAEGGVALVILNDVERAQNVYQALVTRLPREEVHLLHGRLCASERAEKTTACVEALGPNSQRDPGMRMVVVATQVAEQSFDVDADLLVTDLAPVDLLLQRIGRLHRHDGRQRPERLATPRVVVTGYQPHESKPEARKVSEDIYSRYLLLRSAALIDRHGGTWSLPEQIPTLVADGYGKEPLCAPGLREEEERCRQEWAADKRKRSKKADPYLLTRQEELVKPTLDGLHAQGVGVRQEEVLQALVRDGELTVEMIIVRYQDGEYRSLSGDRLGVHGEASEHVREKVLGGLTCLPPRLTKPAQALVPLEGWRDDPWLRYFPALVLGPDGWASLGEEQVGYDPESGLKTVRIK